MQSQTSCRGAAAVGGFTLEHSSPAAAFSMGMCAGEHTSRVVSLSAGSSSAKSASHWTSCDRTCITSCSKCSLKNNLAHFTLEEAQTCGLLQAPQRHRSTTGITIAAAEPEARARAAELLPQPTKAEGHAQKGDVDGVESGGAAHAFAAAHATRQREAKQARQTEGQGAGLKNSGDDVKKTSRNYPITTTRANLITT